MDQTSQYSLWEYFSLDPDLETNHLTSRTVRKQKRDRKKREISFLETPTTTTTAAASTATTTTSSSSSTTTGPAAAGATTPSTALCLFPSLVLGLRLIVDQQGIQRKTVGEDEVSDSRATDIDRVQRDRVAALGGHLDCSQSRVHLWRHRGDCTGEDGSYF